MFARIGSRHFAHLYISRLLRLRLGLRFCRLELALERRRHDGAICAAREDVPATTAGPHTSGIAAHRDRCAPRALVTPTETFLNLLDPAPDPNTVPGTEPGHRAGLARSTCHQGPQEA